MIVGLFPNHLFVLLSQFSSKLQSYGPITPKSRAVLERGFSQGDTPPEDKGDGSLSDTAVGSMTEKVGVKKGLGSGSLISKANAGLTKKSSSTSQLSVTGKRENNAYSN